MIYDKFIQGDCQIYMPLPRNDSLFLQIAIGEHEQLKFNSIIFSYEDCEHEVVDVPYFDLEGFL